MKRFFLFLTIIVFCNTLAEAQCSLTIDQNGPLCYGICAGWASVNANGVPPYTYQWSNLSNLPQLSEVCPGTYSVTVTDSTGCVATGSVTIAEWPMLTFAVDSFKNATCFGYNNGEAWTTASGGVPPYTYNWPNGQNSPHVTGLVANSYYPQVTDSVGCVSSTMLYINSPSEIIISETVNQPLCFTTSGSIQLSVYGGTPAGGASPVYSYLWNNSATTDYLAGLASGLYYVTVTDSIGCFGIKHIVLNTSDGPVPTVAWSDVTCYGQNNGIVTSVSNNTPVASCYWSTGSTSFNPPYPQNLAPGDYWLSVTTPAGCNGFNYFTVIEPTQITDVPSQYNNLCYGDSSGSVYTNVSGGNPDQVYPYYSFIWNNGSIDPFADLKPNGAYSVTVTDLNGCTLTETFNITSPPQLVIDSFPVTNVSCNALNDGYVGVFASGGVPPYYYSIDSIYWDSYDTINWLQPGINYHVIVKDQNYCKTATPYFSVTEPLPLNIYSSWLDPTCVGDDGYASIDSINGGTFPYSVVWDAPPYTGTSSISNLVQGIYYATITDAHACEDILSFDLFQTGQLPVLTGTNVYSGGTALPPNEAEIYLFTPSNTGASVMDTIAVTTNSASVWEFPGLLPGVYYVKTVLTNPASYPNLLDSYYDNTFQWLNAAPIVLTCNDSTNIVLNMYEMSPDTTGNGTISGTVIMLTGTKSTEATGEPVPGAEILIEQEPNDIPVQSAHTDSSGKYTFTGLVAGSGYKLLVDIPGFSMLSTYLNITVTANDTLPNLNFLVDSTSGGGIYIDTASYISVIPNEGVTVEVFPNPFSSILNVKLQLIRANNVSVELFDVMGRKVQTLDAGELLPGEHEFTMKPNPVVKGSCYLVIHAGNTLLMKKLITSPR